eukprot:Skav215592  [mRNA]  locus=scaffold666:136235:143159:+ [translate_table: standard]
MLSKFSRRLSHLAGRASRVPRSSRILQPQRFQAVQQRTKTGSISAPLAPEPPFPTVVVYNQSKHATNSVLADIRAVWGSRVRVIQTLEARLMHQGSWIRIQLQHEGGENDVCPSSHQIIRELGYGPAASGWPAASAHHWHERLRKLTHQLHEEIPKYKRDLRAADEKLLRAGERAHAELVKEAKVAQMRLDKQETLTELQKTAYEFVHENRYVKISELPPEFEKDRMRIIHHEVRRAVEKVVTEMNRTDGIYFEQRVGDSATAEDVFLGR